MLRQNYQPRNQEIPEYDKEILDIARVTRTVAGGRRFSFRATVAAGNKKGLIGVGIAKGKDVAEAIDKAYRKSTKKMMQITTEEGTIPMDVIGHFKSARVLLRPARKGKGLIAGGTVRILCALSGIENISAKILSKSNNKINIARATLNAFEQITQYSLKLQQQKKLEEHKEKPLPKKQADTKKSKQKPKKVSKDKKEAKKKTK